MDDPSDDRTTTPASPPPATEPIDAGRVAAGDGDAAAASASGAGQARQALAEVTRQARALGRQQLTRVRHQGRQMLADQGVRQKDRARHELDTLASALRAAASVLEEEEQRLLGRAAMAVAERVERAAGYLEGHDLRALAEDARRLARRNPEVFLGGLFFGGVALGRFLGSSASSLGEGEAESFEAPAADRTRFRAPGNTGGLA